MVERLAHTTSLHTLSCLKPIQSTLFPWLTLPPSLLSFHLPNPPYPPPSTPSFTALLFPALYLPYQITSSFPCLSPAQIAQIISPNAIRHGDLNGFYNYIYFSEPRPNNSLLARQGLVVSFYFLIAPPCCTPLQSPPTLLAPALTI